MTEAGWLREEGEEEELENCPKCGKIMEKGFLTASGFGVFWQWEYKVSFIFGKNVERLQKYPSWYKKPTPLPSSRCKDCQIMITSYAKRDS